MQLPSLPATTHTNPRFVFYIFFAMNMRNFSITPILLAEANDRLIARQTALIGESRRFDGLALPPDAARKLLLLKLSIGLPAPADPALRAETTRSEGHTSE